MACAKVISEFEVLSAGDVGRRRGWTDEEKVRIVKDSLLGHRQGSATARRVGISRSLLTRWRAEYRAGRLGDIDPAFTAVTVAPNPAPVVVCEALSPPAVAPISEATIEIALRNGRRMTVAASIDPETLARLLSIPVEISSEVPTENSAVLPVRPSRRVGHFWVVGPVDAEERPRLAG